MKILMLGWELPPHNSGGLGVACLNMARALANTENTSIDFVLPYKAKHENIQFMTVHSASNIDPIHRFGNGSYESLRIMEDMIPKIGQKELTSIREIQRQYCDYVEKFLKTHHPDVVHAHDWLTYEAGIIAKKKFNIPLIAHVHATEFDRAGMNSGNQLIHEIEYEGLMMADRIIAVSEITKRIIHEKYNIPLNKIEVVYNSLDEQYLNENYKLSEDEYKYIEALKKAGYLIVSTVGRFTIQKGLSMLMHSASLAITKNPKIVFIFVGDGEDKSKLIKMSSDLGIAKNVIFTGFVRGRKLRDIYALSDVFVMSSVSEPFGLTALEAAHHGDAVILTKQSGVSEVLKSAIKYDFWDGQKLANEIVTLARSPEALKKAKQNVKNEYDSISWSEIAKKCLQIYKKAKKGKK